MLRPHLADVPGLLALVWLIALIPSHRVTIPLQSRDFENLQDCLFWLFCVSLWKCAPHIVREVCDYLEFAAVARLKQIKGSVRALCEKEGLLLGNSEQRQCVLVLSCPFINKMC